MTKQELARERSREAMAFAMEHPKRSPRGTARKGGAGSRITMSRIVLRYSPALADEVLNGSIMLSKAYDAVMASRPPKPKPKPPLPRAKAAIVTTRADFLASIRTGSKYWYTCR